MADEQSEIHFASGEKVEVPGTVNDVHDRLITGPYVPMTDLRGDPVLVNAAHVAFVKAVPTYGTASFG